jgi:DNA-binding NarL/FixJ family response regulator
VEKVVLVREERFGMCVPAPVSGESAGGEPGDDAHRRLPRLTHEILTPQQWTRIAAVFDIPPRELQVIQHIFDGECEYQIGNVLGISHHTVHEYVRRIYTRLAVKDQRELILRIMHEHLHGSRTSPHGDSEGTEGE